MVEQARVRLPTTVPAAYRALNGLDQVVRTHASDVGLEPLLIELVKLRASQLNGCASCIATHTEVALKLGENPERMMLLSAWEHANCYSPRERAALAIAEEITLVATSKVSDATYAQTSNVLTDEELAAVAWVVVVINSYNRIAVTGRHPAGSLPH